MSAIPLTSTMKTSLKVSLISSTLLYLRYSPEIYTDTFAGALIYEISSVCHHIGVVNNDVVEPDGEVVININASSLHPPGTMMTTSKALVTVINDDGRCLTSFRLLLFVYCVTDLLVLLESSLTTISEGGYVTFHLNYSGIIHQKSTVYVAVSTSSGSAIGESTQQLHTTNLCLSPPLADADYEVPMGNEFLVALNDTHKEMNFTVLATDDMILEDFEEMFGIAISLHNPSILAVIKDNQLSYNITILDNEGSC